MAVRKIVRISTVDTPGDDRDLLKLRFAPMRRKMPEDAERARKVRPAKAA